jgi:MinD-like ATPase involved in chromosome partitioning or flagellar assembly
MPRMDREQSRTAIRVAVAAPFPEIVRIHECTAEYADELEVCAMISNADAVLEQARLLQPDVLLLSEGLGANRSDTLAQLSALAPATRLVMLVTGTRDAAPVIADGAVRLGAPAAELRAAIMAATGRGDPSVAPPAHAHPAGAERTSSTAGAGRPPWLSIAPAPEPATGTAPVPVFSLPLDPEELTAPRVQPQPAQPDGTPVQPDAPAARTVLVFSGKGGVGKSVVATNLATALALGGASVALVDLNLQYGDVGVLLHLEAHPVTIDALAQNGDDVDARALDDALATSTEGVRVLLAPTSPESSDLVSASALEAILNQLSLTFDYVVVDSPPHLEERIVGVMEVADQILLVSSFGITSVKDTKVTLRLLQSLGIGPDRVALVVNQTRPRISFQAEEIERALRFPILSNLPYEARMEESVDSGRPLVVSEPRSGFSRQLAVIVEHVGRAQAFGTQPKVRRHAAKWRLRLRR